MPRRRLKDKPVDLMDPGVSIGDAITTTKRLVDLSAAAVAGLVPSESASVERVPVESTRVVNLDLTPAELRGLLAGEKTHDATRFAGALVWVRCRVPEGEAAPTADEVRSYLKAAGVRAARVDVSEVAAWREKVESEVAKLASARERMDWYLASVLASDAVRAEVGRVMDEEGL